MRRTFRLCLILILISGTAPLAFSQTATRIDNFSAEIARHGVLAYISATLRTSAIAPVAGATLDFQIMEGSTWRSITDDLTLTRNVTDSTGRAEVAFLAPDEMAPGTYAIRVVFSGNATYTAVSAETQLVVDQSKCIDEGVEFQCRAAWETIRIATHTTSAPGIPLILVHGNGQDDERNRSTYFGWAALRNSILQSNAYSPFDVFIWKHDTARAIGFNGRTGNAADLADYVNNRLLPKYPSGTKLLFIAHSRGGLVVRSFMNYQDQGDKILRLLTLGTPHHGTPFAVPDWTAFNWFANVNNDSSIFDRVYAFAFNFRRLGSLTVSWDNFDSALNDTLVLNWTSALAPDGRFVLTPADANASSAVADSTVFYSASLKAMFGTLADLNQREKYADRIVRYGAFDDALSDNDALIKSLGSLNDAFGLASDQHKALQVVTGFLALSHVPLKSEARYFANDGLVPLQSALYLDISSGTSFSEVDSERRVSLTTNVSVSTNCGPQGVEPLGNTPYRVWWGSRDDIRDHLDLLETSNPCYWRAVALDITTAPVPAITLQYGFPASAGMSVTTRGDTTAARSGYVRIQPSAGSRTPSGFAIYGFRMSGVLVSETAVQASPKLQRGRIYAANSSVTRTGIAIANPNDQDASISFFFTDASGVDTNRGTLLIHARNQIAAFLDEAPFNSGRFTGTFTFEASLPVAAMGLLGSLNERSEFLMTTLPVAQLTNVLNTPIAIPQFADGGGWTTQVILVNPTDSSISGTAEFFSAGVVTSTPYNILPRSSTTFETAGALENIRTGWVKVTPAASNASPVSLAVFRLRRAGVLVSETGVIGQPSGSSFNLYVETSDRSSGSLQSGVALANLSPNSSTVTLELSTLAGTATGLASVVVIPPQGQLARFLGEFPGFENMRGPFQGVLKIRSASGPLAVVGLRGRINERADFLMATTPPLNNDVPASSEELVIPHFVDGGGYTTQFVLFSGNDAGGSGTVIFMDRNGQSPGVVLR